MVPVATSVSADETEALKAEITKAVEKVQEAGEANAESHDHSHGQSHDQHGTNNCTESVHSFILLANNPNSSSTSCGICFHFVRAQDLETGILT